MLLFVEKWESKRNLFQLYRNGFTSDSFRENSNMYFAMTAYEQYGDATRDNSFEELVALGKGLENETENE